ncbi:MAG: hypothetical protein P4N60_11445 [Verrucomicrobiae bacterium]|nr:hypothetical protein [Verrucomicrobiae bacterium]
MNQPSSEKNRLHLSFNFSRIVLAWLIFLTIAVILVVIAHVWTRPTNKPVLWAEALSVIVLSFVFLGLWGFVRWCCCWRNFRRVLLGAAIFVTLVAIFYTEEDWRGKRAWENCKRDLEAKGVVLDWEKFIPPPVPDDQNFFKASQKIAFSFVKSTNAAQADFLATQPRFQFMPNKTNTFPILDTGRTGSVAVATLTIIPPGSVAPAFTGNRLDLKLNDPAAHRVAATWLQRTLGRMVNGAAGFPFSEFQLTNLPPAQIFVQADATPALADLEKIIPAAAATNIGRVRIEATLDRTKFRVALTDVHITAAADYLKWSDQNAPDFAEIREALKRPYARIDCDYSQPYAIAIPNFVTMRSLAQTLVMRAQCYLLLGQPEKALDELTLMNDSRRILQSAPSGKPMTLVASMINVAITGLYVDTIAYGLHLHAWREPQLAALQAQLKPINLPSLVAESFREEPVYSSRTLETITPAALAEMLSHRTPISLWQKLSDPNYALVKFLPRGWVYQNMTYAITVGQKWNAGFDLANDLILPKKSDQSMNAIIADLDHWSPWNIWSRIAIPNFTKAIQTTAKNQTLVVEGQIACALERHRLAHGGYPETLDALTPQFMDKIPNDIIGGEPMHYRRTNDGNFLLYSIGWNETDDGGTPGTLNDAKKGDWVWQYPTK